MASWYTVKSLYRTDVAGTEAASARLSSSEERIVLFRADSFDEALKKGAEEARQYADGTWLNSGGEQVRTRFLEALDAFSISGQLAEGEEIYSKILFVAANVADEDLRNRCLGHQNEQSSDESESFEPDLARPAAENKDASTDDD